MRASNSESTVVARRLTLPGRLTKTVHVPDGHVALVLAESAPYTLAQGAHRLANWPAPAPAVILVDVGPLPLTLPWRGLTTGDGCEADVRLGAQVVVSDPLRLHQAWLRRGPGPEWPLPADPIAGRLHEQAADALRVYAAADLEQAAVRARLVQALRDPLAQELAHWGLALASPALQVTSAGAAARQAAEANARAAAELARDQAMADVLAELDTRDMFLDQIATWEARTGEKLDAATVEALWRRVAPDGLPLRAAGEVQAALAATAEAAAAQAQTQAAATQSAASAHSQMTAQMGGQPAPLPDTPSDRLNRLYRSLRLGAAVVGFIWAGRNVLFRGFAPINGDDLAGLVVEGLGLAVAALGVGAAAVTYRQAQTQSAPWWNTMQGLIAGLPQAASLAAARRDAQRSYLAADVLIIVALAAGLLMWLGNLPPALLALPLLAFVVAFGLVLAARRRERQARRAVDALLAGLTHPTLPERKAADDLLRRRVAEYLGRVQTNLQETGDKLYLLGDAGLPTASALYDLRVGSVAAAQHEAESVHYRDARYFASAQVAEAAVQQMVDLDADLFRRAQKLALDSEGLFAAATDGDIARCIAAIPPLQRDINQFRRVLGERSAFIKGA